MRSALIFAAASLASLPATARIGFQNNIPNGGELSCRACHNSASGGASQGWSVLGDTIFEANGGTPDEPDSLPLDSGDPAFLFWGEGICDEDSDGDGATNGEELGDPDCVWQRGDEPARTDGITNPNDPQDKPSVDRSNDQAAGGCSSTDTPTRTPWAALALLLVASLGLTRPRRQLSV